MVTWEQMIKKWPELASIDHRDFIQHKCGGWIEKTAKVTDSYIESGSIVIGEASVHRSNIRSNSMIKESVNIVNSDIRMSIISGEACINKSDIIRSLICNDAKLSRCSIEESFILDRSSLITTHCYNSITIDDATAYISLIQSSIVNKDLNRESINFSFIQFPVILYTDPQIHILKNGDFKIGGKLFYINEQYEYNTMWTDAGIRTDDFNTLVLLINRALRKHK